MVSNKSERVFQTLNNLFFLLVSLLMIAPMVNLLAISLSSPRYVNTKEVAFWPKGFSWGVYEKLFGLSSIWRSLEISLIITAAGTLITLCLGSTLAFSLSRPRMKGRKLILTAIIITFIFSVPLIPSYLLVTALGMKNTLWALMIPSALSAFYILILKSFFEGISVEVFESAKIDGCTELGIFTRMVLPLSKAVLATIALFHAVYQWNNYFNALVFISKPTLYPMQIILRNMIVNDMAQNTLNTVEATSHTTPEMIKAGTILFATAPILLVYPFIQRYFVKGAMLGAVKE
ncbi:carbohydrate ABC transporter permease [Paenibacillus cymbidii]|uniref:carbohydrate ABC transporter permease n=1 Tax=Paenibacillus cymbidii TaxID=1639034 RepID=UPI001081F05D|nr:carbohydrate ABC transporter permease [Paenibacillus cymbidii]